MISARDTQINTYDIGKLRKRLKMVSEIKPDKGFIKKTKKDGQTESLTLWIWILWHTNLRLKPKFQRFEATKQIS